MRIPLAVARVEELSNLDVKMSIHIRSSFQTFVSPLESGFEDYKRQLYSEGHQFFSEAS